MAVNLTTDLLLGQDHVVPVLEAIREALKRNGLEGHQHVVGVEGTTPIRMAFHWAGDTALVAALGRGESEGCLVVIVDAGAGDAAKLVAAGRKLSEAMPAARSDALDWLTGTAPPLAALMYTTDRPPDTGLYTFGMCLAAEAFSALER